jgi:hypothetical protein
MLQHVLEIEKHPFFDEIKKINANPQKFAKFIKLFMENFETNYILCKLWIDDVHNKLMFKMNNHNDFLDLFFNNQLNFYQKKLNKKII